MTEPDPGLTGAPAGLAADARWPAVERTDAEFARRGIALEASSWEGPLPERTRRLVLLAASVSASGADVGEAERHLRAALAEGIEVSAIAEAIELACVLGVHTATMAAPLLVEELAGRGEVIDGASPESARARADFGRRRGYWSPVWEPVAALAPDFLGAYLDFSSLPTERAELDPVTRELILLAVNCVTTHLFATGTRVHLRTALALGANPGEVLQVFRLLSTVGLRAALTGFELLAAVTAELSEITETR